MRPESASPGTVYLVGAGPGHPGLITRAGYELLQRCDAVAYDALVPLELIVTLPDRVQRHFVGRRAGKHSQPQEETNHLLVRLASSGMNVVRLKGGDPSVFGRSGEEIEALSRVGIPVVVIPGVTAASAAAAASGFSLTDRRAASWMLLATGHGAETTSFPVPWEHVATQAGGTIVVYMGLGRLEQIAAQLMEAGMPPDTPGIAVQAASTGLQRVAAAPVRELAQECGRRGIRPPALLVIGNVVACRSAVSDEASSLAGRTILVLSAAKRSARLCALLRARGAEPLPYPVTGWKSSEDAEGWRRFTGLIDGGGLCIFTDEIGVDLFIEGLFSRGLDLRCLGRFKIAALGTATGEALRAGGLKADMLFPRGGELLALPDLAPPGTTVVWIRGPLDESSGERHRKPEDAFTLAVSREAEAEWEPHWKQDVASDPPDYAVFTTCAEVRGFTRIMGPEPAGLPGKMRIVSMNHAVSGALRECGLIPNLEPGATGIEELVDAITRDASR